MKRKLNRRTKWKFAKDRVISLFADKWCAHPASFGPCGASKRFFRFFGGIDDTVILAPSEQKYWEKLDQYCRALDASILAVIQGKFMKREALNGRKCATCGNCWGSHFSSEGRCEPNDASPLRFEEVIS